MLHRAGTGLSLDGTTAADLAGRALKYRRARVHNALELCAQTVVETTLTCDNTATVGGLQSHTLASVGGLGHCWLRSNRPASSPSRQPRTTNLQGIYRRGHPTASSVLSVHGFATIMRSGRHGPRLPWKGIRANTTQRGPARPDLPAIGTQASSARVTALAGTFATTPALSFAQGSRQVMYSGRAGRMNCHQQQSLRKGSRCEPDSWPTTKCGRCQHPFGRTNTAQPLTLVLRKQRNGWETGKKLALGHVVNTTRSHE